MTYEKAIEILHPDTTFMALAEVEYFGGFRGKEAKIKAVEEATVLACEALARQIPMKPIERFEFSIDIEAGLCPECNEMVTEEMCFCSYCGQAIDWRKD